jgi:CRP-like cAMP-binding protein
VNARRTPKWLMALSGLTHDEAEDVHRRMRPRSYPPRSVIFQEGDPSDTVVVVRNGRVRLYLTTAEGEEFTLSILGPGFILGLAAAVLGRPRILSAQALGAVDVSLLPAREMVDCMRTIPQFAINLTQLLAILAVENIERSAPLVLDTATERLGRILVALAAPLPAGGQAVEGLTHEDLAKMVGATRTWVSLALADFERKGLLQKHPGKILILDAAGLAARA